MRRPLLSLLLALTAALPGVAVAQPGSVILNINVANPSAEPQTIPLKAYLPKEASPKDIIDLGDLQLDYDPDTGMSFVHAEVTLEAGQSITKTVRMNDVWVFTEERLSSFVDQAEEMASRLEKTPYAEKAGALVLDIEKKVQEVLKRQAETAANPGEHIRAYRHGITTITTIEQDLSTLERWKQEAPGEDGQGKRLPEKRPPGKESLSESGASDSRTALMAGTDGPSDLGGAPLGRSLSLTTAWRIIFGILAFLAVLSVIFFMTWHRLLRVTIERDRQSIPLPTANAG